MDWKLCDGSEVLGSLSVWASVKGGLVLRVL